MCQSRPGYALSGGFAVLAEVEPAKSSLRTAEVHTRRCTMRLYL